jgi:hypothetical protein
MDRLVLVVFILAFGAGLSAQTTPDWLWAKSAGGTDYDFGEGICCDPAGNTYITGYFKGAVQFGATMLDSGSYSDIYVAKLDPAGNWLWAKRAGGPHNDEGEDISIDSSGNIYITGWFQASADFGPFPLNATGGDVCVAKLDPAGNWLWASRAGGEQTDHGYSIVATGGGHCYVAGDFYESALFGATTLTCGFMNDMFVGELDELGNWLWVRQAGGPNTEVCWNLATDSAENCYMTGYFSPETNFGSIYLTTNGPYDGYVAKLDSEGNWLWVVQAGGQNIDECYGVSTDSSGNCYVSGYFSATAAFGTTDLTSYGGWDVFLGKLDPAGNWLWVRQAGGTDYDHAYDVSSDAAGNCYVTGAITGTVSFGTNALPWGGSSEDLFIAKADPDGNWLWAKRAAGSSTDNGLAVCFDTAGNSFVSGVFYETSDFDDTTLTSNGYTDILVAKLSPGDVEAQDDLEVPPAVSMIGVYPNPFSSSGTIRFELREPCPVRVDVFNARGQLVRTLFAGDKPSGEHHFSWDGRDDSGQRLPRGVYLYRISAGTGDLRGKMVLLN